MRKRNKILENGLIIVFVSFIIFTSGFLISLMVIPFLHPTITTPHLQIYIHDDSDFEKYNFPGSGTESDPFLIENFTYQEQGLLQISISGVSKYFIVRNNVVISQYSAGIHIGNVAVNASIINNVVYGSPYNYGWDAGIAIYDMNGCKIINNTVISKEKGIQVWTSSNCSLQNNRLIKNDRNIEIKYSSQILIKNNYVVCDEKSSDYDTTDALNVDDSEFISIISNQIENGWLFFEDDSISTATIEDNYINGVKLGFFKNFTDFSLNSSLEFGQLILAYCTNCSLSNLNLSDVNVAIGIYQSSFINCNNCNFSNNLYAGLYIYDSLNITISNSTFVSNDIGTRVRYSSVYFYNNEFQNNFYGVYISKSNCTFGNNSFIDNVYHDIYTFDY